MRRYKLTDCLALTLAVSVYGSTLWAESGAMKPEPKRPEGVQTQWAIAPEGGEAPTTAYPEGTLLQKDITLPAGTLLPGGAVLPQSPAEAAPTDAPMSRSAVDLDAATGVPYISGGIGVSGREEMEGVKSKFNLRLLFAVKGSGAYLADVKVRIDDAAGPTLLTAVAQGPWFYADLAPGSYVLTVDNAGQTQSRDIQVPATGAVEQSFYWTD